MNPKNQIKLGIPNRELRNTTLELFELAGYDARLDLNGYKVAIDDPEVECVLAETCDIPSSVHRGAIDAGITQHVFVVDFLKELVEIAEIDYGNGVWHSARLALSVPQESKIKTVKDLQGKKLLSRVPNLTKEYLKNRGVEANVEYVAFPGEPKVRIFGDALVDLTNTGNALRTHNLRIVDTLMESNVRIIMNKGSYQDKWKREKVEDIAVLLDGARRARDMAGLMLHVSNKILEKVLKVLPALKKPTITPLKGQNWFDVLTVANEKEIRKLIPQLKKIGCTDIIEFPLNKVVL